MNFIWRTAEDAFTCIAEKTSVRSRLTSWSDARVSGSGTLSRLYVAYSALKEKEIRIVAQRISGFYRVEIADAMEIDDEEARNLYRRAIESLRTAQKGEQACTSDLQLRRDIESCFDD